ncbi:hypothetical protein EZS27_023462 [termite gut metagenome]|uniref:Uncharacterized protein n=1 Tax=termite gut metagenome TaxID=433724 RepID=A0A5J4R0T1_9ZZZZ
MRLPCQKLDITQKIMSETVKKYKKHDYSKRLQIVAGLTH